jgi:hypothetical protein
VSNSGAININGLQACTTYAARAVVEHEGDVARCVGWLPTMCASRGSAVVRRNRNIFIFVFDM